MRRLRLFVRDGRPEGASRRGRLQASRLLRLIAIATLIVVASIAVGAASRPHSVEISLSALQPGEATALVLLVLAGAMGLLLGATRYPMWVRSPPGADGIAAGKSRLPWAVRVLLTLLPVAVVAFVLAAAGRLSNGNKGPALLGGATPLVPANTAEASGSAANLVVACLVVALTAGLVAAVLFRNTRPAGPVPVAAPQDAAAEILDEGLGAMLAEHDPRKAVIAAYVAMERAMARKGWARRPHEAPTEYLARVLGVAPSRAADLDELVGLYELARFSEHTVTASMRDAAVDSVRRLRAELQEPV